MNLLLILVAFCINFVFFFFLPLAYFFKDEELLKANKPKTSDIIVSKINLKKKEKKIKKLRIKKVQLKPKVSTAQSQQSSRFNLDLNANFEGSASGSGFSVGGGSGGALIYSENQVDKLPVRISGRLPKTPKELSFSKRKGTVEIEVVINEVGKIISAKIILEEPSGYGLGRAATDVIWGWGFRPGSIKNIPVSVKVVIPIRFE